MTSAQQNKLLIGGALLIALLILIYTTTNQSPTGAASVQSAVPIPCDPDLGSDGCNSECDYINDFGGGGAWLYSANYPLESIGCQGMEPNGLNEYDGAIEMEGPGCASEYNFYEASMDIGGDIVCDYVFISGDGPCARKFGGDLGVGCCTCPSAQRLGRAVTIDDCIATEGDGLPMSEETQVLWEPESACASFYFDNIFFTDFSTDVCGDGSVTGSEECDDGNTNNGDCCDSSCMYEASGSSCTDGAWCNGAETCDGSGTCQAGSAPNCDDAVACTDDSCDEESNQCAHEPNDASCEDGLACNGIQFCHPTSGCQMMTSPPNCDDGKACTTDSCNETTDSCDNIPIDEDNDGSDICEPDPDCNDTNDSIYPRAAELLNGVDDDCDLFIDEGFVTGTGGFDITVDGTPVTSGDPISGNGTVGLWAEDTLLIEFDHDFDQSSINFSEILILVSDDSILVMMGDELLPGETKTIYITDNDFQTLCVKDAEVLIISEVSKDCNGAGETIMNQCLHVAGPYTQNGITCTKTGEILKIENLTHSAVVGVPEDDSEERNLPTAYYFVEPSKEPVIPEPEPEPEVPETPEPEPEIENPEPEEPTITVPPEIPEVKPVAEEEQTWMYLLVAGLAVVLIAGVIIRRRQ